MRLVGYIRVSTDKQRENTSLESQQNDITRYCENAGHELIDIYQEVETSTGKRDRPVFRQAIRNLSKADGLVVCKMDRFARNARDVLALVEDVFNPKRKALIMLNFSGMQVDTSTPVGKLCLTVLAGIAELECETIRERTQNGRRAKAEKGGYAYGGPQFGQQAQGGKLVRNETEMGVIRCILDYYDEGLSLRKIARILNVFEVKTKFGRKWSAQQISNIVKRSRNN